LIVVAGIVLSLSFASQECGAQKRSLNGSLSGQLRIIQVRMVSGRISAVCPVSNQSMTSNVTGTDRRERLTLNLGGGKPNISYESANPRESVSLNMEQGAAVTMRIDPTSQSDQPAVQFVQDSTGAVRLTIGSDDNAKEFRAKSVWQLMLAEPEACREHLLPLLQLLRPGWQVSQQAESLEEMLCRSTVSPDPAQRAVWQQAIKLLGSPRYVERERAEQQLLDGGQRIIPTLQGLSRGQLDAEQAYRVRRVVRQLTGDGEEDTPDRVAFWLAEDPRVWHALASRDDLTKRRIAASRLSLLLPAPVEFDPEATAEQRTSQLTRIREQHAEFFDPPASSTAASGDSKN